MSKKVNNIFCSNLTFMKFYEAHNRARKNKTNKREVIEFEMNLEQNLVNLIREIESGRYKVGEYRSFVVYEPKERVIEALPYRDRVVHQWYVHEFIFPYILPKFIDTTYACLDDKGTHNAVAKIEKYMRIYKRNIDSKFWILKCDISKFFYSINPKILFEILCKTYKDKKLLKFTKKILFENREKNTVGIPIGNYTSQYFANIYLNGLDQYAKRILSLKYYVRYMDDFIILLKTKEECIEVKKKIEEFIESSLNLKLNKKSRYYPNKIGVNFCGYRTFCTHRLLRVSSKKKIKRKIKKWNNDFKRGNINITFVLQSLNSWLSHTSYCNSYNLKDKISNSSNCTYNFKYILEKQEELIEIMGKCEFCNSIISEI